MATIKQRLTLLERLTVKPATQLLTIAFERGDGVLTDRDGQPIQDQHNKRLLVIHVVKPSDSV